VNHILVSNDYVLNLKKELWDAYFNWAKIFKEEQKNSIYNQAELLRRPLRIEKVRREEIQSLNDATEYLIEMQKLTVNNIIKYGYTL
jgi:hypothetical protein